jgi:predicted O-methyltransferase YrrM
MLSLVRVLRSAADVLEARGAASAIRAAPAEIEPAYDFISRFRYGEIRARPVQIREEFQQLLNLLQEAPPQRILELGTARGGTLFLLTRVAASAATLVTVDMPGSPFGGGYPQSQSPFLKSFARKGQHIQLVRGDSHDPATFAEVSSHVRDVDFLFIDGDHTYDGVRQDWEMYSPLVSPGGLIAFHDIVEGRPRKVGGVPRFWSEIRAAHPEAQEFVQDRLQGGFGIGVIRKIT